jgi:hypothetical protein
MSGTTKILNYKARTFIDKHIIKKQAPRQANLLAPTAELETVARKIEDLARWGNSLAGVFGKELKAIQAAEAAGKHGEVDQMLGALTANLEEYYDHSQRKRNYAVGMAKVKPMMAAADLAMKDSAAKNDPNVQAQMETFAQAKKNSAFSEEATAEQVEQRMRDVQNAADSLIAACAKNANFDKSKAVRNQIFFETAYLRDAAERMDPETHEQSSKRLNLMSGGNTNIRDLLGQIKSAKEFFAAEDQISSGDEYRPPAENEKEYYRKLARHGKTLEALWNFDAPNHLEEADLQKYRDLMAAFKRAKNNLLSKQNELYSAHPGRFTEALTALNAAIQAARPVQQAHADVVTAEIKEFPVEHGKARSERALELANGAPPVVLRSLPPAKQAELINALIAGAKLDNDRAEDFKSAHDKIYLHTQLDEEFLNAEKAAHERVQAALMEHKEELQKAQKEWPAMDNANRLKTIDMIARVHSENMDFSPVPIKYKVALPTNAGSYMTGDKCIALNEKWHGIKDFEAVVATIFHENSHNRQYQLIEQLEKGTLKEGSPEFNQAILFQANSKGYAKEGEAYEKQPLEANAFRAGDSMAKKLLRALAE